MRIRRPTPPGPVLRWSIPLLLLAALLVIPALTRPATAANAAQALYGPALDKGGGGGQNAGAQNKGGSNQGNGAGASQGHGDGNGGGTGNGQGNGNSHGQGNGAGNNPSQGAGNGNGQGNGNANGAGQPASHGSVTKTADRATAAPGDVINYTITLRNAGGATNVTLSDNMPEHTSFVSASGACHVVGGDGKKISCVVAVGPHGVATVHVALRVAPNAPCNSVLTNVAHVNGWGSAQAQTRLLCTVAGTATPAVTGTAGPPATATHNASATATEPPEASETPEATEPPEATETRSPSATATATRTATPGIPAPTRTPTRTVTPGVGTPSATATATTTATATPAPPPTVTPSAQAGSLVAGRQDTPWWALAGTVLLLIGVGAAFAAKGLRGAP